MNILDVLNERSLDVVFGLISAGALAFCRYLWKQNKQLQQYEKENDSKKYREMILSEIEPILDELARTESELKNLDSNIDQSIINLKQAIEVKNSCLKNDLDNLQAKTTRNFDLIINSYKFRLIQLCKTHLKDGYISEDDFEQVTEMYKLYNGLGGNGQAQDYYARVLNLEIR